MSDHADTLRKALDERFRNRMPDGDTTEWDTYAALDALVKERDEARASNAVFMSGEAYNRMHDAWHAETERAEAAEAERDEAWRSLASMEVSRVDVIQQERMETAHFVARAEAAEARVKELEHALRRIATQRVAANRPESRAWDYEQVAAEALAAASPGGEAE